MQVHVVSVSSLTAKVGMEGAHVSVSLKTVGVQGPRGFTGPPGEYVAGPGLRIVGDEIRFDLANLTRG
jgi:hypothetical protein